MLPVHSLFDDRALPDDEVDVCSRVRRRLDVLVAARCHAFWGALPFGGRVQGVLRNRLKTILERRPHGVRQFASSDPALKTSERLGKES
jgi:hypothetical protein